MEDNIKLLKECNSGLQMGIDGISHVIENAKGENFVNLLEEYEDKHKKQCEIVHRKLNEEGYSEKEASTMASVESFIGTKMKMMINDSDEKIADLMTDGCNMGMKSVSKYINQYGGADENVKKLANDVVILDQNFMKDLRKYL